MADARPTAWPAEATVDDALRNGDGAGVKIAILDSGVESAHPALAGLELVDDWIIASDEPQLMTVEPGCGEDKFGHGTAVASIIRRHAPAARLGSFRVLGTSLATRNHLIKHGVMLALERGYQILNCSFGCRDDQGRHAMLYKEWLDQAYLQRVHVVAACNNDNVNIQEWPAFFSSCIAVNMANGSAGNLTYRRDHLVEFAANGDELDVPWLNGTRKIVSGSSFAAPVVTAYLARLLSVFPDLSVVQAKALLQHHASSWREEFQCKNSAA